MGASTVKHEVELVQSIEMALATFSLIFKLERFNGEMSMETGSD